MLSSDERNLLISLPDEDLFDQAWRLFQAGDRDLSIKIYKILEKICRNTGDDTGLLKSLFHQSLILLDRDDLVQAERTAQEAREICLKHKLTQISDVNEIIRLVAEKKAERISHLQQLFNHAKACEAQKNY